MASSRMDKRGRMGVKGWRGSMGYPILPSRDVLSHREEEEEEAEEHPNQHSPRGPLG